MVTVEEHAALVEELLGLELRLDELGNVVLNTSQGPYSMREQMLFETVPAQKAYNDLYRVVAKKRKVIEAIDTIARYRLALAA